jgi:uncharacterized protein
MTNFIPLFPLSIVVFPGEKLNLHIFEPRYKQLINDCYLQQKAFGIPSVIKNEVSEIGTLVTIDKIVNTYEDGKMDITVIGTSLFSLLEKITDIPNKLYVGGIVTHLQNNINNGNQVIMQKLISDTRLLHQHLKTEKKFAKPDMELVTYDIAHHVGLPIEEEYYFLTMLHEFQREEYLRRHLKKTLQVINEMELLKEKIKLNGHFKHIKGL